MKPDHLHAALLAVYGGVWRMARPLLRRNARLAEGYDQRLAPDGWTQEAHLWVQAASGGEAYLAWELLRHLDGGLAAVADNEPAAGDCSRSCPPFAADGKLSVLLTSCTRQGVDVLEKARDWAAEHRPGLHVQVRYFPFDEPHLMRRALDQARPCAVALLETELWPGLLSACAARSIPVAVVNGRMTPRTLAGYLLTPDFWRSMAPARIAAISPDDAQRFGLLFGHDLTSIMPNIKFDRAVPPPAGQPSPQASPQTSPAPSPTPAPTLPGTVLRPSAPLVVLGSVREEEETALLPVIQRLLQERPDADIAVAPRHMHRVPAWVNALEQAGLPWELRSRRTGAPGGEPAARGMVLVWDVFGELAALYASATAVFVGGSLARLGGQNFLEPLTHGVAPCVGPSRENFAWVGGGLAEAGLLTEVADGDALAEALLQQLRTPLQRDGVCRRFEEWMAPRRGGGRMAADLVLSVAGLG
ncbi:3-deoxy-D-manno-octulosonic acid transferase [Nitratidesulfovibrio sp. HK-II]|uniref:3-deoxy-D-manno-octulosonic acid transferase n=1 Tax=Nitratidesulfovibrio sp. HK-II TaxID=2009266 RepID=UPI000E2E75CA|nr:glycosyltransferase N-terminal domain-containing protein [Nitratidesulfovibrio sp. HK-II]GBO97201.1 3-deoxy-D-manno-octulosonic-acid transferase [Nitratidesulfovibrio sp. HK-II]